MTFAEPIGGAILTATINGRNVQFFARDLVGSGEVSTVAGTGYSISRRDGHTLIQTTSADPVSVTVRPSAQTPMPSGARVSIAAMGAGQVTIVAGAGVTIRTPETLKSAKQYALMTLVNLATDEWLLAGYLEAAP